MTEKLKRCPFCKGDAELIKIRDGIEMVHDTVQCQMCGAMGRQIPERLKQKEIAIAAWNTRAADENSPLTLDELRQMEGENER